MNHEASGGTTVLFLQILACQIELTFCGNLRAEQQQSSLTWWGSLGTGPAAWRSSSGRPRSASWWRTCGCISAGWGRQGDGCAPVYTPAADRCPPSETAAVHTNTRQLQPNTAAKHWGSSSRMKQRGAHLCDSYVEDSGPERTQLAEHYHAVLSSCCWRLSYPHQGLIPEDEIQTDSDLKIYLGEYESNLWSICICLESTNLILRALTKWCESKWSESYECLKAS